MCRRTPVFLYLVVGTPLDSWGSILGLVVGDQTHLGLAKDSAVPQICSILPCFFRTTSLDFLKLSKWILAQGLPPPLVVGEEAWDEVKRGGGVGEKPQRCAPDRKSGRRRGRRRGGGRKLREEGNSHQPDSESYAGEKPGQDATQQSAELGEDLGRASEVRTVRTAGFSPARKLSLERRKLFFLSAQESGTEASSGRARLGSGDSRRGPQGGEWGSPWRAWSHHSATSQARKITLLA